MAVRVRITSIPLMFLLLCSALLATTLQGVQGEVDVEGPSESECRPYIEKALKQLETGDTQSADVQDDDITHIVTTDDSDTQSGEAIESNEPISVEEGTQEVEDEQNASERDTREIESVEVESAREGETVETVISNIEGPKQKPNQLFTYLLNFFNFNVKKGDTQEASAERRAEESHEQADAASAEGATEEAESAEGAASVEGEQEETEGTDEQKSEETAEDGAASVEETEGAVSVEQEEGTASVEDGAASVEEETATSFEEAEAQASADEGEDAASAEEAATSAEEAAASAEEAASTEEAASPEETAASAEAAENAEEAAASTEEGGASAEEAVGSTEATVSSAEEAASSTEEAAASAEEAAATAEDGEASEQQVEGVASAEEGATSTEAAGSAEETAEATSAEHEEAASVEQEDGADSREEAAASAEDTAEAASAEQEETAQAASAEQDDTAEAASAEQEGGASAEDTAETASVEETKETASAEETADVASVEETIEAASVEENAETASAVQDNTAEDDTVEAASTEQDGAASAEDGAASTEGTTETTSAEQDQAASAETTEAASAEETAETTSAEQDQAASTEQSEAAASTEQADEPASAETQPSGEQAESVEGEQADEPSAEAGTENVDSQQTEEEAASTEEEQSQEGESTPEEDLTWEVEVPSELRPRAHVNDILNLNDENTETDNIILKAADKTLNELKRIYENAIKPLETLYKYRDLSNRHFGDPEIFSKPLVLFMGPWSGGKSSIINYLLDNEYTQTSLRTGAEPSPAYFNILMHGEEPEVLDGTQLAADWTFSGLQKFGQGLEERLRGLKLPNRLLEKINIVEIPGILEVRKQVSRMFPFNDACQWFIDRADIIFLVYDPSKLDVGPETEAILDQLKGREYQTRIILNKADQVKPEELMRVQGALIWNISPLMSSAQPPVMYSTSLWSRPYESGAPIRLLLAQERAFLRDLRTAVDKRIENKIASARRFAVRVRNHAKMVDCYLTTYYNHKSVFGNKKMVADQIIEHPQDYHIYEGLSTLTNISRYDLPDPDVYRDFFRLNPLYDFQQLSATCTYFRGCPINRLDIAIAYDLPELVGKYKKMIEPATNNNNADSSTKS